jgi:pimeloyl-ACP methyl ester carboxylesterase
MLVRPNRIILLFALSLASCAPNALPPQEGAHAQAVAHLKQARKSTSSHEQRAFYYVHSAAEALRLIDSAESGEAARKVYNMAATDLAVMLRGAHNGKLWNSPQSLTDGNTTYRLQFAKGNRNGTWDPELFTSLTPAAEVDLQTIERRNRVDGIGGALVGIRKTSPLEPFSPFVGVTAPVTVILDFKGNDVTLSLVDPAKNAKSRIASASRQLEADYSAPLAYYPNPNEFIDGLMGALRVQEHMGITGLYMLEPYDPDRIPIILVHGLISTPRIWRNVINELEMDPKIRERYQFGVFAYPTGNPPLYSAMRLREALASYRMKHPAARDFVIVGHSMGGILSRTQVTRLDRDSWNAMGEDKAEEFFKNIKPDSIIENAVLFDANPHIDRAVFICTPHRGSKMAIGTLGDLAMRMISLPSDITTTLAGSVGNSISIITGDPNRMPTSIHGLSPTNPTLKVLDQQKIQVPYHSIIADRGKGDSPNSSDGVVEYWSSHLKSAQSEKIVPGSHSACELPETIEELKRILHLHLNQN